MAIDDRQYQISQKNQTGDKAKGKSGPKRLKEQHELWHDALRRSTNRAASSKKLRLRMVDKFLVSKMPITSLYDWEKRAGLKEPKTAREEPNYDKAKWQPDRSD